MYAVSREDLSVFINSAEWALCSFVLSFLVQILKRLPASSSSNDPVLHFVLFVPSLQRRPLRILARDSECLSFRRASPLELSYVRHFESVECFHAASVGRHRHSQPNCHCG